MFFHYTGASGRRRAGWGDVTIASMGKYKPVRKKGKTAPVPRAGLPCAILMLLGIAGLMFFLFYVLGHANG